MRTVFCLTVALLAGTLSADAQPKVAPATWMVEPGKVLLSDDLNTPFGKDWNKGKGKWQVVDGAMRGAELADDEHGAVKRRDVKFDSAVITFAFKLEGAKAISLSINGAKGHLGRVRINATGFTVQRDKDKVSNSQAVPLDTCKVDIKKGEWHTMVIEMHGKEMLARMDDRHVAFGEHPGLDAGKTNVGLTVAGESASFKNLRVHEGSPTKGWEKQKAKLLEQRKK